MVFVHDIIHTVTINAPAALVREVMLDFDKYPDWSFGHFKSITVAETSGIKSEATAKDGPAVGSTLEVKLNGMEFKPKVVTNTAEELAWLGAAPIPYIFDGRHAFRFHPVDEHTTEFTQSEHFVGVLVFLMKVGSWGTKTDQGFRTYNDELKKRCEELAARKQTRQ